MGCRLYSHYVGYLEREELESVESIKNDTVYLRNSSMFLVSFW